MKRIVITNVDLKKNISKAYKKIEEDSKYKSLYNSNVFYISGQT